MSILSINKQQYKIDNRKNRFKKKNGKKIKLN